MTLAGSTNPLFAANCRAIRRADLIDDPRFANNAKRVEYSLELNDIFSAWCADHLLEEVLSTFEAAQGTIAPIYSIDQIAADPQMKAREAITRIPDKDFGSIATPCIVPRFSVDPTSQRNAAGALGQDNKELYMDGLGLSQADVERLARNKVI